MADFIGHLVSGILVHANNSAVSICSTVGDFVHRRAMVIAGILRYAAEQGGAMSANMFKVWCQFWEGQASMVVSTPPLSAEDKNAAIENVVSDTSSNNSSTEAGSTASDNSSSNTSSGTSSAVNAQKAFFAEKKRRKAKRPSNNATRSFQRLHEETSKDDKETTAPFSASATLAAPATSSAVPGAAASAARPAWQTLEDLTTDWQGYPDEKKKKLFWVRVN